MDRHTAHGLFCSCIHGNIVECGAVAFCLSVAVQPYREIRRLPLLSAGFKLLRIPPYASVVFADRLARLIAGYILRLSVNYRAELVDVGLALFGGEALQVSRVPFDADYRVKWHD